MSTISPKVGEHNLIQVPLRARKVQWTAAIAAMLLALLLPSPPTFAQSSEPKRVLLLMQEDLSWPLFKAIDDNVRATMQHGSPDAPDAVLIFGEHLDRIHFPDLQMQAERVAVIKKRYAGAKLDLVIGVGDVPTDLFPGVPFLYLSTSPQRQVPAAPGSSKRSAGLWIELDARKTLDAARRFHPSARQVIVIGGSSPSEKDMVDQVRAQLALDPNPLPAVYLTNLALAGIRQKVATLGPENIVLFVSLGRDGVGHPYLSPEVASQISAVSSAPVYVLLDTDTGSGAVGGFVTRFGEMGKQAGEMGLQLLAGRYPKDQIARSDYLFDWRQLKRWKISEASLPVGSIVTNRRPTVWEAFKWYILGAVFLFLLETFLLLALLWHRAKKKAFHESLLTQMAFEKLLSDLSTTFINLPEERVGPTIEKNLGRIAALLKLDRITLFEYVNETAALKTTIAWHNDAIQPVDAIIPAGSFPWHANILRRGETVLLPDTASSPEEASDEMSQNKWSGAGSIAIVPLKAGEQFFGAISFATAKRRPDWTSAQTEQLKLLAAIFSNALMRKSAQEARFKHAAIVESSADAIISMTLDGIISSWNAGAQQLFGYTEFEAIGQPIKMLVPEELHSEEDQILRRLRAGERIEHYETVRLTKSGRKLNISLTVSPIRDSTGKVVGASKIARDITDEKRAQAALRNSEEQFRLFMDHSPASAWMKDAQGHYIYMSEVYLEQIGIRLEDRLGKTDFDVYPSEIASQFRKNDLAALAAGHALEFTEDSITAEGEPCTWLTYKFPFQDTSGQIFVGGIGVDITERKLAEQSLHNLTGRLISAQEEERARIARELHDDFSQRLALLGISLGQLWKKLPEDAAEDRSSVMEMLKGTMEMSTDLHTLSHQLHSSKLEHVGLGPALTALCAEIGKKYKMEILFGESGKSVDLPKDVALCLFRVAQEALTNAVKHSQSQSAQVELRSGSAAVTLRVSDSGRGFDPLIQKPDSGIGMIGMRERLRLIGGRLRVTSRAGCGTEICAEVPLVAAEDVPEVNSKVVGG